MRVASERAPSVLPSMFPVARGRARCRPRDRDNSQRGRRLERSRGSSAVLPWFRVCLFVVTSKADRRGGKRLGAKECASFIGVPAVVGAQEHDSVAPCVRPRPARTQDLQQLIDAQACLSRECLL